ncbi:XopAD/skwp family type III secretion system effector [Bradyrhizobium sp. Ec3.3]|uniref:XopAD/skwp family type III secretion system effector n=1 Tax=Bradyrhizobium sp. Ec3.3 TaxID=189753 RepID=UPI000687FD20|nr:XopAD/skwp family type III secretion system effector [Bradyrhizobium sp. Ec3.3]
MRTEELNAALQEIDRARDIRGFSIAVVDHAKRLRGADLATFLQKAAGDFEARFVGQLVGNIRSAWGYATACNAVSREGGGRAGIEVCRALAARVSRLDDTLMRKVEPKALSLFASSFGRHAWAEECRNGAIRIAEFCRYDTGVLRELNCQSLSLLANGFSKWPEESECRDATLAIADELLNRARRGADGLRSFPPQQLSHLVNGFSKWPQRTATRRATLRIADEVLGRVEQLSRFTYQDLANLANGFSKWPDRTATREATLAIADEVLFRGAKLSNCPDQELAALVNAFSKWPDTMATCEATLVIAREVLSLRGKDRLPGFNPQGLANLVNGFSKWPAEEDCRQATVAIGREICRRTRELARFNEQHLANLVNGFSKWPTERVCGQATAAVAREVRQSGRLSRFSEQELANLVNGCSKWPKMSNTRKAAVAIATEIHCRAQGDDRLSSVPHHFLANLVNGFSKWPEEEACRQITIAIANEVRRCGEHEDQLSRLTPQGLSNLVNGFSKWPAEVDCGQATAATARELLRRAGELSCFEEQHLANLVNGFSKWPAEDDCGQATAAIAREALRRAGELSCFEEQHLAILVNGFSKWPEDVTCRQATAAIAARVGNTAQLSGFNEQETAMLANGFSKWPEEASTHHAMMAIASDVLSRPGNTDPLSGFTPQGLASLANGFSHWPEEASSREVIVAIAAKIQDADRLAHFDEQELTNLVNALSKWPDEEVCFRAIVDIASGLGTADRRFASFSTPQLGIIANAVGRAVLRGEESGEISETALLKDRLHRLAHYLHYASDRLEQAELLSIANLFKPLAKARLFDDLSSLASVGLNRLDELRGDAGFASRHNLEAMGHLCVAVLPLARSPHLRWHRRQALNLLNDLQGIVEEKIAAHIEADDAERIRGPYASRRPALSIYQVLKTRAILKTMFRRPYVEGKKSDLQMRQQDLQRGTREILRITRDLIERDLSNMCWNLIAEIESDGPVGALDSFLAQDAATILAQHHPAAFDVHRVLRDMDHEPTPPKENAGLMQLPVVDMQGRRVATERETRYSAFHRLTAGAVPVVAVQLPAKPSAFMLARTLTVDGVPYRMDLFGGGKLKPPRLTVAQIAGRTPGDVRVRSGGQLLAIPYADTAAGTDFERMSRAWAPFKEAYFYTQRRGFAAPPAIKGLGPHDSALEGAFRLSLLPDRPEGEAHPFRLSGPQGPIALRPHDGCGFIKASLAERMLAVRRGATQDGPERVPAYGEGRRSSLPASALQHYPRSEQVADEAEQKTKTWLQSREGKKLTFEQIYRTVTVGNIGGPGAVAVPSSDGRLHVPALKSETLTAKGGVLIGRSPYDKANLRPFAAEQVRSATDGDPTAAFLDTCVAMQYSFNAAEKSHGELAADNATFFAKGILIVAPDAMWPTAFADRGVVLSAEDVKCHSRWTERKDRVKEDTSLECVGILQATEVFAPGSLVAVPPDEQKRLDGDFDGDTVIILGDRPALYQHVRQFDQEEQARGLRSLKPPKSHTPAIEGERYQFSRTSQILAATQNVLETYTGLQRTFLAQSHDARGWFAERAVFGTYEGIQQELKRDLRELLNQEQPSRQDIQDTLVRARHEIEAADHAVAREIAGLLVADLGTWATDEHAPPVTAEGSGNAGLTLSTELWELFPDLAEAFSATAQPRERVQMLVDHYPARIHPRPDGYHPDDLVRSANNLLSLGIKVGTDAYKSDTGAGLFLKKSHQLQRLLQATPGLRPAPYSKNIATSLNQGRLDLDATLANLKDNPTLAASVMEASIKLSMESGILPEPSGRRPAAADSIATITLTREEAAVRAKLETERAKIEEETITTTVCEIAETLRTKYQIEVEMPHVDRRLKSERTIRLQLTGVSVPCESASQLINNAVRHVFRIPDGQFAAAFRKAMLAFDDRGYAEVSTTNWFRIRTPNFVGIKTVLATAQGYRFELEFHTPDSYRAKLANHDTYKELEEQQQPGAGNGQDQVKSKELELCVREVCKQVAIPEGAKDILHWRAEVGRAGSASSVFTFL